MICESEVCVWLLVVVKSMSQRQSARYLRTVSHSSQVVNSFEFEEKSHPIQSLSESVHHIIPSSNDPSSHSEQQIKSTSIPSSIPSSHLHTITMTQNNSNTMTTDPSPSSSFQNNINNIHNIHNNNNSHHTHHHIHQQSPNNIMKQKQYNQINEESKSSQQNMNIKHNNINQPQIPNLSSSPELQEVRIFEPGYSQWQGTNIVCCKGRIVGGPEIWKLLVTTTIIIIPTILYLSFTLSLILYMKMHGLYVCYKHNTIVLYMTQCKDIVGGL